MERTYDAADTLPQLGYAFAEPWIGLSEDIDTSPARASKKPKVDEGASENPNTTHQSRSAIRIKDLVPGFQARLSPEDEDEDES